MELQQFHRRLCGLRGPQEFPDTTENEPTKGDSLNGGVGKNQLIREGLSVPSLTQGKE